MSIYVIDNCIKSIGNREMIKHAISLHPMHLTISLDAREKSCFYRSVILKCINFLSAWIVLQMWNDIHGTTPAWLGASCKVLDGKRTA